MQMWDQHLFQFHKVKVLVLLLLLSVQVQARPTFNSIALIDSEDTRPTNSSGGYIDGIDKFVVEFSFTRTDADNATWLDNRPDPQRLEDGTWTPMTCRYDASLCPQTPGECYCKSQVGDVFTFVYNPTASSKYSGVKFRVSWEPNKFFIDPVRTTELTLPDVCSQLSVTYTTLGETKVAGVTNTVEKPSGNATLTYTVGGLEGSYTIKIQKNGADVATSTTNTVTTNVEDTDLTAAFTLWYDESTSAPGCGRSDSGLFPVTYTKGPVLVTYTTQGKTGVKAMAGKTNKVEKEPGSSSLTFNVANLVAPYKIELKQDGKVVESATNGTSVTTSVAESDIGKVFTLSYTESSPLPDYQRSGSVSLVFTEPVVTTTVPTDGMTTEPDGQEPISPAKPSPEKDEQGSDTGMIIGVVLALVVGSLIGLILFATLSRATGVQAEPEGTGVQVNWSSALFPFKGETLVVNRKGAKDPYTSKDISKNESSVHSEDSKKHAASVNDLPPDTYTVSVVTNRWGWNTKSKATNFVVEAPGPEVVEKVPKLASIPSLHREKLKNGHTRNIDGGTHRLVTTERDTHRGNSFFRNAKYFFVCYLG